ncbi:hypothetical protein VTN02DRAFT_1639 [Thermoascus thermophilus]
MAAVNRNMFDASIAADGPNARGPTVMVLPLNIIALIISYLDNVADLARVCRTCRILNYMTLPQLYKNLTLTSYDRIRYRDEQPVGWGSASPFSMGLNAVITRPHAALVRSMTLRGEWREHDLEEHARVGRVPDSSMMLNIAVRAAVDRMRGLESFSWELNTKMLETVYVGLSQLPNLTSLTVRFPSSRHPRPMTVIPPMPHLRSLKITDIDPLCYPDDISTLLHKSRKLQELKMHWSPRMREAQEPSVMLHDYFRKCIAAKEPLRIKKLALQNLYAVHTEELNTAFDQAVIEEISVLNNPGVDETTYMNTFVDNSWPNHPPSGKLRVKAMRHDGLSKKHCDLLAMWSGLERLYFVNPIRDRGDYINSPRQSGELSASTALSTPPIESNTTAAAALAGAAPAIASTPASPCSPAGGSSSNLFLRESYLNNIFSYHGSALRHLLLPSRWPLQAATIARLVDACPNLEQLGLAPEIPSLETLGLLLPSLRKLVAVRLLIPTSNTSTPAGVNGVPSARPGRSLSGFSSSGHHTGNNHTGLNSNGNNFNSSNNNNNNSVPVPARIVSQIVELDDNIHNERIGYTLADKEMFGNLRLIGLGWKTWELGEFYTIPAESAEKPFKFPPARGLNGNAYAEQGPPQLQQQPEHGQPTAGARQETLSSLAASAPAVAATAEASRPSPPPSVLGKRSRESEPSSSSSSLSSSSSVQQQQQQQQEEQEQRQEEQLQDQDQDQQQDQRQEQQQNQQLPPGQSSSSSACASEPGYHASGEKVLWRRRVRRVGWDVLKHWEIWGLDLQEI